MINLSVTGKKMVSPNLPKKQPQIINPFLIQSKPINQKPQLPIRPKPSAMNTPKVPPRKQSGIKVEPKKQIAIKKQEKLEQKQAPLPPKVEQKKEEKIVEPKKEDVVGQVTVRYNHYKQNFPSVNGVLSFQPIQQKYSFADVFRGRYLPVLKKFKSQEMIAPETVGSAVEYSWMVEEGQQYKLEITEDEEEELKHEKKAYKASDNPNKCPLKKNARFQELTAQLKQLDPSEYGSAKHKALLEQRDLEDVLFS